MNRPILKSILLAPLVLFALVWLGLAVYLALFDDDLPPTAASLSSPKTIAILGASGTAGDGILAAALADPDVETIHVITRRITPRMQAGIDSGKVRATLHQDYLDYAAVHGQLAEVEAVFWAIGLSSVGLDEETYRRIHVAFPRQFVEEWLEVSEQLGTSFHYISSSDISPDSKAMWARVKVEAENALFDLARGTRIRVIAYRPDYIRPTQAERHIGQNLLYWFFAPVGAAVEATDIGRAMLEVAAHGDEFVNADKLGTRSIIRYGRVQALRLAGDG